jgi:pimeloyl-ACP methyl ester carboxylesterase
VFVHGLWLSGAESFLLRRRLAQHGWRLRVLPYSSLGEQPDSVARRCARQVAQLAERTAKPVHLLGHSLGGLLIYRMFDLGLLEADRFSGDFCRVIFLGTPCAGTRTGQALARWRYGRQLLGQAGAAELLDARPRRWRFEAQLGVIAGNLPLGLGRLLTKLEEPHDGTVCVAETQLEGATARCVLPVSHTGLWIDPAVAREIVRFLESGAFSAAGAD